MKYFKPVLRLVLAACLLALAGCGETRGNSEDISESVTQRVIGKFMELTEIPRPSLHEEQVSDFLKAWAEKQNFAVVQDDHYNLVIEVPAAKGYEDRPLVILQGHMDMVFVQQDGLSLDPLATKIQVKNDGVYLTSDGTTSLGADDGIGIAIMECVAEGYMDHGPLRLIITTNEEDGMSGAANLDAACAADAGYMINLDDEIEGEIVISSASGVIYEYSRAFAPAVPQCDTGVELFLRGLTGGHSGDDIGKGRANAVLAMGRLLRELRENGIGCELSAFTGGTANNAIPTGAKAVLCIEKADYEALCTCCNAVLESLRAEYAASEGGMALEIAECEKPVQVMPAGETERLLRLTAEITDGVYSMSTIVDGLVESSSNLGRMDANAEGFSAGGMMRSSDPAKEEEIIRRDKELAAVLEAEFNAERVLASWPAKENNRLQKFAEKTYKELFGKELNVVAIHAGLECSAFAGYNPDMDIISMGPTVVSPHSVNETLTVETIEAVWKLLEGILSGI